MGTMTFGALVTGEGWADGPATDETKGGTGAVGWSSLSGNEEIESPCLNLVLRLRFAVPLPSWSPL